MERGVENYRVREMAAANMRRAVIDLSIDTYSSFIMMIYAKSLELSIAFFVKKLCARGYDRLFEK